MKRIISFFFHLCLVVRSFWYFKVLGRKRDVVKDRDCKWFEESGVNIANFQSKHQPFDVDKYDNALMAANKPLRHFRNCYGDGHFKCYECMNLDYNNSDLIQRPDKL